VKNGLSLLSSRAAWAVLGVTVVVALAIGSVHGAPQSPAARVAQLDAIIKCPSCEDLSIAQSEAPTAVALRAFVAAGVQAGESDSQIENAVVARYGADILLQPRDVLVWVLPLGGIGLAVGALGVALWRRRSRPAAAGDASLDEDRELVAAALAERQGAAR
jgi:cytochrome c-type biogenesis protein CcmH